MKKLLPLIVLLMFGCFSENQPDKYQNDKPEFSRETDKLVSESLLLKDFIPKSIFNIPRTDVQKAKFPVIDVHSHTNAKNEEEIAEWVESMDKKGIEKTLILTAATGMKFDSIYDLYSKFEGRFDIWCGFDYTGFDKPGFGPEAVKELERCAKKGAKGVGELGDKGEGFFYSNKMKAFGMHADDPRMDPLFKKCAELNLPINIHVAEPKWMYEPMDSTNDALLGAINWRLDNKKNIKSHSEMIDILERAVKRHPNTTFIACHYANLSYDLSKLQELLDNYPNLFVDISARFFYVATTPRFAGKFYEKYQDRILYGTDWGRKENMYELTFRILESDDEHFYGHEYEFNDFHWPLNGLGLDDSILEKVYRGNAIRIL